MKDGDDVMIGGKFPSCFGREKNILYGRVLMIEGNILTLVDEVGILRPEIPNTEWQINIDELLFIRVLTMKGENAEEENPGESGGGKESDRPTERRSS